MNTLILPSRIVNVGVHEPRDVVGEEVDVRPALADQGCHLSTEAAARLDAAGIHGTVQIESAGL